MALDYLNPIVPLPQTTQHEFELFTYNQTEMEIYDADWSEVSNGDADTTYNYDDRNDDWEDGYSNWETMEFTCLAEGGRPKPNVKW